MKPYIASILFVALAACSSPTQISESDIQTAIAETESETTLKISPSPVFTETPSPTETSTPTPTPDTRVINIDPYQFLLPKSLLPNEGKYYLPASDWITPHRNSEVVAGQGVEEGRIYLAETGRVDGWVVSYLRGTTRFLGPEVIYDNVVLYKTTEGAQLLLTKYSNCSQPETIYEPVEVNFRIGDLTNVCKFQEMQPGGENRVDILVEFSYRNIAHTLAIWGWEYEIDLGFAESLALSLLAQLEGAPLSSNVTFSP